ncbi:hypothetical protein [Umezawaea sp.]|uniref:hypothetical protein n=1 Tax=Umezawaea sp. TaxID=1955258 RepID=UPI002ED4C6DE
MIANLLLGPASVIASVVLAVASATWALASVCKTVVRERSRTARFTVALKDSAPGERAAILRAWVQVESGRADDPAEDEEPSPDGTRLAWVRRLLPGGRGTEPGKE